jgi:hypothetical protein
MIQDSFACYVELARIPGEDRQKTFHLLVDVYAIHTQHTARELPGSLNIQMHFILAGLRDQYQPLDRRVFGAFKSSARIMFLAPATIEQGAK